MFEEMVVLGAGFGAKDRVMYWSSKGRRGKRWNVMSGFRMYIDLSQKGLDGEVSVELADCIANWRTEDSSRKILPVGTFGRYR